MAKKEDLLSRLETAYEEARKQEQEELHNALAEVIAEQKASIPNILLVLEIIKFELLQAKYREVVEGTVKLTDKPPIMTKPKEK